MLSKDLKLYCNKQWGADRQNELTKLVFQAKKLNMDPNALRFVLFFLTTSVVLLWCDVKQHINHAPRAMSSTMPFFALM